MNSEFLQEPAYRWLAFGVAAMLFLRVWKSVVNMID